MSDLVAAFRARRHAEALAMGFKNEAEMDSFFAGDYDSPLFDGLFDGPDVEDED